MELDKNEQIAVGELGEAVNVALEQSEIVAAALEKLRDLGLEPNLSVKLEIGLQRIGSLTGEFLEADKLDLTDEDMRTLQRMKIKI